LLITTSDLHEASILLRLPNASDNTTPDQLYKEYGQPALEKITRLDAQPLNQWVATYGVVLIWFGDASDTIPLADSRIFLGDFGESFQAAVDVRRTIFSRTICVTVPRDTHRANVTRFVPAKIWRLACAVFAIMGQRPLFESWFPSEDRILEEHVDTLGYLPKKWWARWVNRNQYLDDQLRKIDGAPRRLLEDRLEASIHEPRKQFKTAEMDEEEKQSFLILSRSMLSFRPDDRPSAEQVLESI
jgi:hypothetical protein